MIRLLLLLFLLLSQRTFGFKPTPGYTPLIGDANLDGVVNLTNAELIMQYVIDPVNTPIASEGIRNSDVSGDGTISCYDASLIAQRCPVSVRRVTGTIANFATIKKFATCSPLFKEH